MNSIRSALVSVFQRLASLSVMLVLAGLLAGVEPPAWSIVTRHSELMPAGDTTVVFRDRAFADDVARTNLAAILHQHGLQTVRSL